MAPTKMRTIEDFMALILPAHFSLSRNGRGIAVTIEEIAVGVKGTLAEMFLASEVTDNKRVV